jgi:hypothetical protein
MSNTSTKPMAVHPGGPTGTSHAACPLPAL